MYIHVHCQHVYMRGHLMSTWNWKWQVNKLALVCCYPLGPLVYSSFTASRLWVQGRETKRFCSPWVYVHMCLVKTNFRCGELLAHTTDSLVTQTHTARDCWVTDWEVLKWKLPVGEGFSCSGLPSYHSWYPLYSSKRLEANCCVLLRVRVLQRVRVISGTPTHCGDWGMVMNHNGRCW